MLEHLFGSKTRAKLLTVFIHHPEQAFFVRELTRVVETQINAVRRELENLVGLGMVIEIDGPTDGAKRPGVKRKYYQINARFPLLKEIQTLVTKAHLLLERKLDREISNLGEIHYLALLGVFMGQAKAPVDLFLVGVVDQEATHALIRRLEKDMGFEINFTCMTPQEYKYRKEITDRFLYSILESNKNVVVDKLDRLEATTV